jgi:hypothetical protein
VHLLKASEKESGTRGALLLEQAAYIFLLPTPHHKQLTTSSFAAYFPLVRKYAFHLVMAGHLFHT